MRRVAAVRVETGGRGKDGEKTYVEPDAWIELRVRLAENRSRQYPLWLELDRGSERVKSFKRKVRGIVGYIESGHYRRILGTARVQVAIAVDQRAFGRGELAQRRIGDIIRWIEEELGALGKVDQARLFSVGTAPADHSSSHHRFLAPVWHVPFHDSPISLLDLPQSDL